MELSGGYTKDKAMKRIIALLLVAATPVLAAYKPRLDVSQGYVTTNELGIGGNYTTGVLDLGEYTQVQTHINASHDGTMKFEFISDSAGSDVVRTLTIPYKAALGFQLLSAPCFTPYVRYSFTNTSGSAQTDFFFETRFLTKGLSPQVLRADATVSPAMVSDLVRISNDPEFDFSRGLATDKTVVHKFGANGDIDTGSSEVMWPLGTAYNFPTNAQLLTCSSSVTNDEVNGPGARTIYIEGLGADWTAANETLNLNGTAAVTSSVSFVRVNRAYIQDVGTYGGDNVGNITVANLDDGNTLAYISATEGQSEQLVYSVPTNRTAYLVRANVTALAGTSNGDVSLKLYRRLNAHDVTAPMSSRRIVHEYRGLTAGPAVTEWKAMQSLAGPADIWAEADASTANSVSSMSLDLYLVTNDNPTDPQ